MTMIVTNGDDAWGEVFLRGCASSGVGNCQVYVNTDHNANAQRMEAYIRSPDLIGIALEVSGSSEESFYREPLREVTNAGLPTVVISSTLIEAADPLADQATSIIGVSTNTYVSEITKAVASAGARDSTFCILADTNAFPNLDSANEQLGKELQNLGASLSQACPSPLTSFRTDEILSWFRNLAANKQVSFVILPPFRISSRQYDEVNRIIAESNSSTLIVSAWPDPYELGRRAAFTLLRLRQGERVERQQDMLPVLQIGTGPYCETCLCEKDVECREACLRCSR